jgi:predicted Fe-Mo cluster-binding NifX family protein
LSFAEVITKNIKEEKMRIALTVTEKSENAKVDPRFGRCAAFCVYDEETGEKKFIDNTQNLNAAQGAGIQAAQNILKENINVLITGNVGPKAFGLLQGSNVKIYIGASGMTIDEAIKNFKDGKLEETTGATKPGHW